MARDTYLVANVQTVSGEVFAYLGNPTTLADGDVIGYVAARTRLENLTNVPKVLLNPTQWNDIIMSAVNLRTGNTPPTFAAFQNGVYGYEFINAQSDELHGAFELQHGYKEGTNLDVHVHWSPTNTNTGNCVWNFEYTIANVAGTFGATTTLVTAGGADLGSGVINSHIYHDIGTISGTVPATIHIGAICAFRVSRPAGDAFTGDAFLHSIGIHYQCDTIGSANETSK
jgi:hypothetical protein